MAITPRIRPCVWFADQAEQAAEFYTGIFPNLGELKRAHAGIA
jgi:predicted 3-demethylubiquinone-9 3-methyltransferase (glyoxalase superfamily)